MRAIAKIIQYIIKAFRKEVSFNEADRILQVDMLKAIEFIKNDAADMVAY